MQSTFILSRKRSQKGAQTVEVLFVIPAVFMLVFVTLELTNVMRVYSAIVWATEYGVREASASTHVGGTFTYPDSNEIKSRVAGKLEKLSVRNVDFSDPRYFCLQYKEVTDSDWGDCNQGTASDHDLVKLSVAVPYDAIILPSKFSPFDMRSRFERVIDGPHTGVNP